MVTILFVSSQLTIVFFYYYNSDGSIYEMSQHIPNEKNYNDKMILQKIDRSLFRLFKLFFI